MKKITVFGTPLSREEMKKITGGTGFMNWICTCDGQTWTSGCESYGCVQLQIPSHCGANSGVSCKKIASEP